MFVVNVIYLIFLTFLNIKKKTNQNQNKAKQVRCFINCFSYFWENGYIKVIINVHVFCYNKSDSMKIASDAIYC